MQFKDGLIAGTVVKRLAKHSDQRGWLVELFRQDELEQEFFPVMSYISETLPGVARGPHEHRQQADLFCFVGPSMFRVYLWDSRKHSPTYGNRLVFEAGESAPLAVVIPAGVVHAYKNIGSTPGWVVNFPNRLYAGHGRTEPVDEIRYENDPQTVYTMD
jgi:dTDP-4-dehydrorhamnose 3,5-epimerase